RVRDHRLLVALERFVALADAVVEVRRRIEALSIEEQLERLGIPAGVVGLLSVAVGLHGPSLGVDRFVPFGRGRNRRKRADRQADTDPKREHARRKRRARDWKQGPGGHWRATIPGDLRSRPSRTCGRALSLRCSLA